MMPERHGGRIMTKLSIRSILERSFLFASMAILGTAPLTAARAEVQVRWVIDEQASDGAVNGNIVSGLEPGDTVRLFIEVANPDADSVSQLFTFVSYDASILELSDSVSIHILDGGLFSPNLAPVAPPSPSILDATKLTGLAHVTGSSASTSGLGPDLASRLDFHIVGDDAAVALSHSISPADCSEVNGFVIEDCQSGELAFGSPVILVVPEPGQGLLLGTGILSLAWIGRRGPHRGRSSSVTERVLPASKRRRVPWDALAVPVFITLLALSSLPMAGTAQSQTDTDGDGVPDSMDNCTLVANGPNDLSDQVDTDQDGFGNVCDGDFDNNGVHDGGDFSDLVVNFNSTIELFDLTGDGFVTGCDHASFRAMWGQLPGPSGLSCAGTIPCPP